MSTLKGIFPNPKPQKKKNFLQENVKSLREMEKYFHSHKDIKELEKLDFQKQQYNKYQNVAARVNSSLRSSSTRSGNRQFNDTKSLNRKSSAPVMSRTTESIANKKFNKNHECSVLNGKPKKEDKQKLNSQVASKNLPKALLTLDINDDFVSPCETPGPTRLVTQGSQTLDTNNINTLYAEGVIRYPSTSSGHRESPPPTKSNAKNTGKNTATNFPTDRGDSALEKSTMKDSIDYVKLNKEKISVANKMAAQLSNGVVPPHYRKGVVPKYILERKEEEEQKQMERAKALASNADCPEGHVPLPDNERKETLRMLKKNYQEYVDELNKMPIRSDTLRAQRRKMEIEKQLTKLEDGIKIFSRPKVFVRTNA